MAETIFDHVSGTVNEEIDDLSGNIITLNSKLPTASQKNLTSTNVNQNITIGSYHIGDKYGALKIIFIDFTVSSTINGYSTLFTIASDFSSFYDYHRVFSNEKVLMIRNNGEVVNQSTLEPGYYVLYAVYI